MQCLRCVDAPNATRGYPHLGKNMISYTSKLEFLLPQILVILFIWGPSSSELGNIMCPKHSQHHGLQRQVYIHPNFKHPHYQQLSPATSQS
jgi:polyferredoxin